MQIGKVIHTAVVWNIQLWDSGGQRWRSHGTEVDHKNPSWQDTSKTIWWLLTKPDRQAHIIINAHCIAVTGTQEVKVQGHTRPKIDLEAWQRQHSRPLGSC